MNFELAELYLRSPKPRRPSVLTIKVWDRHAENIDPAAPLCEHDDAVIGVGDTLELNDGHGPVVELRFEAKGRLVIILNHLEYRLAYRALERIGRLPDEPT